MEYAITRADRRPVPVEIVLHPSWWYKHTGLTFDEDFFYHPVRRVEVERVMEQALFDRFGRYGLGTDRNRFIPAVGATHLAAGFLVSEMLGCEVRYTEDAPPQVICANRPLQDIDIDAAFASPAYTRFERLCAALKASHGHLAEDVNWSGVLNIALDVVGQNLFQDLCERPADVRKFFGQIAELLTRFTARIASETGTTSNSVNRTVRQLTPPVFLHSACSLHMISASQYVDLLMPIDWGWSLAHRAFGIHYCGPDPHRFAQPFSQLPRLAFLDVGWGGDVQMLREYLPATFLNIRLSPVDIGHQSRESIHSCIFELVAQSGDPWRTGICCINMDDTVGDDSITTIFEAVEELRTRFSAGAAGDYGTADGVAGLSKCACTDGYGGTPVG